jgi:uncharacterized protein YndB with AHSA1/START domain
LVILSLFLISEVASEPQNVGIYSMTLMIPSASHNNTTLVLRWTFTASRQRVFRTWITPRALEHWLRPRGMSMTVRSLDARVGGSFCFELEDGSSLIGTYLQIVPPEKLVYTWSGGAAQRWETVVTLDFLDRGAVTEVVVKKTINSPLPAHNLASSLSLNG